MAEAGRLMMARPKEHPAGSQPSQHICKHAWTSQSIGRRPMNTRVCCFCESLCVGVCACKTDVAGELEVGLQVDELLDDQGRGFGSGHPQDGGVVVALWRAGWKGNAS